MTKYIIRNNIFQILFIDWERMRIFATDLHYSPRRVMQVRYDVSEKLSVTSGE
mgnify:CR=1 FL=1